MREQTPVVSLVRGTGALENQKLLSSPHQQQSDPPPTRDVLTPLLLLDTITRRERLAKSPSKLVLRTGLWLRLLSRPNSFDSRILPRSQSVG